MATPPLALLRTQSDARLTALARDGHKGAFEVIVGRYRRELVRHGRRVTGEARAEDVVQHALLAGWTALQRGDDVRELRPWLHRIVHNTALNTLRGSGDEHAELREAMRVGEAPDEELERRLDVRETLASLARLPDRQREALLRVAVDGQSQDEVAEAFGLTHGAVGQLVHRARTALRAAATAVTPIPVASWLASAGTRAEPVSARLAELVGQTGSAGIGVAIAKGAALVVLAGAAGPALVEHRDGRDTPERAVHAQAPRGNAPSPSAVAGAATGTVEWAGLDGPRGGRGSSGSSSGRSGPGSGGRGSRSRGSGHGSGSSGSGSSANGHESESSGSGSGSTASGSGPSGSTSGSSGSGSSGSASPSGSGGSGSGGSGSSGSSAGFTGSGPSSGSSGSPSPDSSSASGSNDTGAGSRGTGGSGDSSVEPVEPVSGDSGSGGPGSG